jgi:hypothetical protein
VRRQVFFANFENMKDAIKAGVRGLALFATIGFGLGFLWAFGMGGCCSAPEPPLSQRFQALFWIGLPFSLFGLVAGFVSSLLWD